ncbi:MAG: PQQ-binding-like beta-propeller repeat protein [Vicinamibacterales bacterium]
MRCAVALLVAFTAIGAGAIVCPTIAFTQGQPAQMIEPDGEAQQYWSRWRGPSGQGLAVDSGYPDVWSDTENIKWRSAVPGRGHSSPIIWRDQVFLTTAYPDGRVSVLAYDRVNGRRLWEAFGPNTTRESLHQKNTSASATPATDGRRVYASFGNKGLLAVDLSGRVLWHQSVGYIDNYHGPAGSPLLYKDRLIIYQDHGGGAFIAAFDTATGRLLWRTSRNASIGWGSPIAIRAGSHDEIIVSGERRVVAYNPDSGAEIWSVGGNTYEVIPTPVVGHGLIFCSSGRAGPTMAIRPGGSGNVTRSHVAWTSPRGSPFVPSPVLYGDALYLLNDMTSIATSLHATTGKVIWQGRLGMARREGFSASPVAVDGKVFFTNDDGETFVVRAGPVFEIIRVNRLGAPVLASPALVDRTWFFRTAGELVAIGN